VRILSLENRTVAAVVEDGGYGVDPSPLGGRTMLKNHGGPVHTISKTSHLNVQEQAGTLQENSDENV
jgi:hypothetical protein